MLNAISDFFQRSLAQPEQRENQTLTLELATAALLCEIVRADYDTTDEELAALRLMLTERYQLTRLKSTVFVAWRIYCMLAIAILSVPNCT